PIWNGGNRRALRLRYSFPPEPDEFRLGIQYFVWVCRGKRWSRANRRSGVWPPWHSIWYYPTGWSREQWDSLRAEAAGVLPIATLLLGRNHTAHLYWSTGWAQPVGRESGVRCGGKHIRYNHEWRGARWGDRVRADTVRQRIH